MASGPKKKQRECNQWRCFEVSGCRMITDYTPTMNNGAFLRETWIRYDAIWDDSLRIQWSLWQIRTTDLVGHSALQYSHCSAPASNEHKQGATTYLQALNDTLTMTNYTYTKSRRMLQVCFFSTKRIDTHAVTVTGPTIRSNWIHKNTGQPKSCNQYMISSKLQYSRLNFHGKYSVIYIDKIIICTTVCRSSRPM